MGKLCLKNVVVSSRVKYEGRLCVILEQIDRVLPRSLMAFLISNNDTISQTGHLAHTL